MKNIIDVLKETPKKDKVIIRWTNKYDIQDEVAITEEQLRYLQVNIAKGEIPYDKVVIVNNNTIVRFNPDGRLASKLENNNCLSLNDNLAMELLYAKAGM